MLHAAKHVSGGALWANLHLLFWLSLVPWITNWIEEEPVEPLPTALYGVVLIMAGTAYFILQKALVAVNGQDSALARAVGRATKERVSTGLYACAIALAFWRTWAADLVYAAVAIMWLVPDRRIERVIARE